MRRAVAALRRAGAATIAARLTLRGRFAHSRLRSRFRTNGALSCAPRSWRPCFIAADGNRQVDERRSLEAARIDAWFRACANGRCMRIALFSRGQQGTIFARTGNSKSLFRGQQISFGAATEEHGQEPTRSAQVRRRSDGGDVAGAGSTPGSAAILLEQKQSGGYDCPSVDQPVGRQGQELLERGRERHVGEELDRLGEAAALVGRARRPRP